MIVAKFSGKPISSITVSGHAGFAEYGKDIVCAAVTSAVQLTINGITEILKIPADVKVLQDKITIHIPQSHAEQTQAFTEALYLHLNVLAEDYVGTIKVIVSEV